MDWWQEWLTAVPAGAVGSTVGVSAFIVAILTGRLMTLGQHLRRVADLIESHARETKELRESRDIYREAARLERERADKATDVVHEVEPTLSRMLHVMESLDRALPPRSDAS